MSQDVLAFRSPGLHNPCPEGVYRLVGEAGVVVQSVTVLILWGCCGDLEIKHVKYLAVPSGHKVDLEGQLVRGTSGS